MPNVTPYTKTTWKNLPTKTTPINETNLNHMETGIKNVTDFVNTLDPSKVTFTLSGEKLIVGKTS